MTTPRGMTPREKADLLPGERLRDALECAERERAIWFAENSAAQASLGRVRDLCNEWAAAGGIHRFHADLIRDAIDGEDA